MGNKASLPENFTEIESFLSSLFGELKGYVYAPTKSPATEFWQEYYFKWPEHKREIATHMLSQSRENDCYIAPSLFKAPSSKRPAWKGTNFVWVEFDGNAPETPPEGIPLPSIRIQSSVSKHEHWYWRIDKFETDSKVLEGLTKSLTYTLDADKSGWECNQVLRAPGTLHQESSKRVKLLSSIGTTYSYANFKNLVTPPETAVADTTFSDVPDIQTVIAKYKWDKEAYDLFHKPKQPVGSRSSAMTALGFFCVEMGMTNEECYSVLFNADERWGKYKNRPPADRAKRLIGIITHCRSKKELDAELRLTDRECFVSIGDFRQTDIRVRWVFEDFLTEQGLGIISASPGVGKSTLSLRLGVSVVTNKDFLIWKSAMESGKRVGFLSLEMAGLECKQFLDTMWPSFSKAERELIDKNFFLLPLGYSLPLASKEAQQMILDEIDKHEIDFLIIDSLKAATGLDERKLDTFFDWINKRVRNERKCTVWLIHHNRKPSNENGSKKPRGLEDLYGDTFISAHPTTVISLHRVDKSTIEVLPFKVRLAAEIDPFRIVRQKHMDFAVDSKTSIHDEEPPPAEGEPTDESKGLFGQGDAK